MHPLANAAPPEPATILSRPRVGTLGKKFPPSRTAAARAGFLELARKSGRNGDPLICLPSHPTSARGGRPSPLTESLRTLRRRALVFLEATRRQHPAALSLHRLHARNQN